MESNKVPLVSNTRSLGNHRDGQAQLGSIFPGQMHTRFAVVDLVEFVGNAFFGWRAFRIRERPSSR